MNSTKTAPTPDTFYHVVIAGIIGVPTLCKSVVVKHRSDGTRYVVCDGFGCSRNKAVANDEQAVAEFFRGAGYDVRGMAAA